MRENRKSGSEGGAIQTNVSFLPLSVDRSLTSGVCLPSYSDRQAGMTVHTDNWNPQSMEESLNLAVMRGKGEA